MRQPDAGLRIYLLGRFEVVSGERAIIDQSWPRRKAKTLFKLLALNAGQWLHRDQVLDAVWPDMDPAAADHNFRQNLHYLRRAFAAHGLALPVVSAARSMLSLPEDAWVDANAFRAEAERARATGTSAEQYESALALYSGDLLPEDIYEEWTESQREDLKALRRRLLFDLGRLHQLQGRSEAAARRLEELVRVDPLDEEAHRALMRLYGESGNRQRAARLYERCRELLKAQLDLEPSEETQALHRELISGRFTAGPRVPQLSGALIGREHETKELRAALEGMIARRGQVFLLAGEAGIGKTRVAEELALSALLAGAQVIWARCYEGDGAPAYWPWIQAIRSCLHDHSVEETVALAGAGASDLAELAPELRAGIPARAPASSSEFGEARFRLFDSLARFLKNAADRQPTVLILDDLHWADTPSLLALEFLASEISQSRLLLLCTYRDTEVKPASALSGAVAALGRRYPGHTLHLGGLSEGEVGQLMRASTGQEASERVLETVYDQTGGNPFLVLQLADVILAAGLSEASLDAPGWGIVLPRGAQSVILHSLERLSASSRDVLTVASVVGKEFGLDVLKRLSGMQQTRLLKAVEEAVLARLITELPGTGRFAFRHALLREALYGQLPMGRRAELHRVAGEALEQAIGPEDQERATVLAYHFFQALPLGTAAKAIQYTRLAGDRALSLYAYEEAVRLYQNALDAMQFEEKPDEALRCELLLSLGNAMWSAGNPPAGRQMLEGAAVVARKLGAHEQLARAALNCGRSLTSVGTVDRPLVNLLEEALAALPAEDTPLRATTMASLARALYWSECRERRTALAAEAVAMARRTADAGALAYVLDAVWVALWQPENPEERLALAGEMLNMAQETGDKARAHQGRRWRMIALLEMGEAAAAREAFQAQVALAREMRQSAQLENVALVSAMWALFEGRLSDGERLVNEALAGAERARDRFAAEQFGAQMLALRREQGRLGEIEPAVKGFVQRNPAMATWRAVLAYVCAEQGREPEARAEFELLAADGFAKLHRDYMWLTALSLLSDVCFFLHDEKRAEVLYDLLLPFASRNAVLGYAIVCAGSVSRCLGLLASVMGRREEAERHFRCALEMDERMGARPWVAWTQYEYGLMLLQSGDPADAERAPGLLEGARSASRDMGLKALESRLDAIEGWK